jgi:MoxR-like ATPase
MGLVRRVPAPKVVVEAAVRLARMTRPADTLAPPGVREHVAWGAGPRASQYMVLGAKARAAMDGRPMADLEDVEAVVLPVLRHRIVLSFHAEAAGRKAEDVVREVAAAARRSKGS